MDFFGHQARARVNTRRLVLLFALAVLGITLAVMAVVGLVFGPHPPLLLGVGLLTLAVIGIASLVRSTQLQSGGSAVAQALGATPIPSGPADLAHQRLRNVVEEIAIASGVPVPEIFVLEQEEGINAFAAGWSPADAAVAVTRGALERLDRDELQGVIAHEFSHILNGDMRMNIRLMGALFGIMVLAMAGRAVLRGGRFRSRGKGAGGVMLVALGVMIVGYLGLFVGRLIKAGVSRQREFLADAAAVQFTRQTRGLAGALRKIAAAPQGARLTEVEGEEVSHMLFGDGLGLAGLLATHPPIDARLVALEGAQAARAPTAPPSPAAVGASPPGPASAPSGRAPPGVAAMVDLSPAAVVAAVGNPGPAAWDTASALHAELPATLKQAALDTEQAAWLVCALALGREPGVRERQLASVAAHAGPAARAQVAALADEVARCHPAQRLPLAALSLPALRHRPRARNEELLGLLAELMRADGRCDLSEYCLARLMRGLLRDAMRPRLARVHGRRRLVHCVTELSLVLAVLAQHGHADRVEARRAWLAGLQRALPGLRAPEPEPEVADWLPVLERALPVLDGLDPAGKQLLVEALTTTLQHDGQVTVEEAELLRTVCAVLHCPLPPWPGSRAA